MIPKLNFHYCTINLLGILIISPTFLSGKHFVVKQASQLIIHVSSDGIIHAPPFLYMQLYILFMLQRAWFPNKHHLL